MEYAVYGISEYCVGEKSLANALYFSFEEWDEGGGKK